MPLMSMPNELLVLICESFEGDQQSLKNLSLTCSRFANAAKPTLFHRLACSYDEGSALINFLASHTHIPPLVKDIAFAAIPNRDSMAPSPHFTFIEDNKAVQFINATLEVKPWTMFDGQIIGSTAEFAQAYSNMWVCFRETFLVHMLPRLKEVNFGGRMMHAPMLWKDLQLAETKTVSNMVLCRYFSHSEINDVAHCFPNIEKLSVVVQQDPLAAPHDPPSPFIFEHLTSFHLVANNLGSDHLQGVLGSMPALREFGFEIAGPHGSMSPLQISTDVSAMCGGGLRTLKLNLEALDTTVFDDDELSMSFADMTSLERIYLHGGTTIYGTDFDIGANVNQAPVRPLRVQTLFPPNIVDVAISVCDAATYDAYDRELGQLETLKERYFARIEKLWLRLTADSHGFHPL
ncbi:hypothetical protein N3K66_004183 [Trichothecium roseum]|uniref:Uncharacterized protein n=1 Tax=Trichothecium roseum TaxID=47278 RepID=A0ACC0V1A6_9HYPO|nr:hypothetical protein N3K66_004183 [Trichothecium roseum]